MVANQELLNSITFEEEGIKVTYGRRVYCILPFEGKRRFDWFIDVLEIIAREQRKSSRHKFSNFPGVTGEEIFLSLRSMYKNLGINIRWILEQYSQARKRTSGNSSGRVFMVLSSGGQVASKEERVTVLRALLPPPTSVEESFYFKVGAHPRNIHFVEE